MDNIIPAPREGGAECPTPTKARFATDTAAEDAARRASFGLQKQLYVYPCTCGWLHLTSKKGKAHRLDPRTAVLAEDKGLSDQEFALLVRQEVIDQANPEDAAALRRPENLLRWKRALSDFQLDINHQFASKVGVRDPEVVLWRARLTRVQRATSARQAEVKSLLQEAYRAGAPTWGSGPGSDRKARRAIAGERAVQRLREAHPDEFARYLVEEFEADGLEVPEKYREKMGDMTEMEEETYEPAQPQRGGLRLLGPGDGPECGGASGCRPDDEGHAFP